MPFLWGFLFFAGLVFRMSSTGDKRCTDCCVYSNDRLCGFEGAM